jgi:hypothetical protein
MIGSVLDTRHDIGLKSLARFSELFDAFVGSLRRPGKSLGVAGLSTAV